VDLASTGSRGMIVPEVHGSGMQRLEATAAAGAVMRKEDDSALTAAP
jgi:hypothetical protein